MELHSAHRDDEIEYDPEKTKVAHVVAKASQILRLENGSDEDSLPKIKVF